MCKKKLNINLIQRQIQKQEADYDKDSIKSNGMMCGMCEAHMNDLVRKNFQVKKVTSSVKDGETVVISEENLDIPFLKKEIKEIGYELVDVHTEPYEKKGFFHFGKK